jgi:L-serine dehydratase
MGKGDMPVLREGASQYPSIFNDVIGPVMRGPSSSHCAAAVRIGRLARDLVGGEIAEVLVEFHPEGSLATTHEAQGSDMGLFGGLLGWDATDPRLVESARALKEAGIQARIRITEFPAFHPNTYRLTLRGKGGGGAPEAGEEGAGTREGKEQDLTPEHRLTALSTGGGIVRVVEIDGIPLSIGGDFHETLVFLERAERASPAEELQVGIEAEEAILHEGPGGSLVQVKTRTPLDPTELRRYLMELRRHLKGRKVTEIRTLAPVLPILSRKGMAVPFLTAGQVEERGLPLWELATRYEMARGDVSRDEVQRRMEDIVGVMEGSVAEGLAGTSYEDRILPPQTGLYEAAIDSGMLLDAGMLNRMVLYVSAIMEVKSSMGVVVAAPTAGSCGALPGAVLGAGHTLGSTREEMARAMLAAGLVGVFITAGSTFAAEECGCQAECGAGSGMAAAALVTLMGGTADQALGAASMALQNTLGMICDPVANRVEVPCLGRNVLAAGNALTSANMALAGFDPVIPLDEVIRTMDEVGKALPRELRCTALGGLSVTKTSRRIEARLDRRGGSV